MKLDWRDFELHYFWTFRLAMYSRTIVERFENVAYNVQRMHGLPFQAKHLNIQYHPMESLEALESPQILKTKTGR